MSGTAFRAMLTTARAEGRAIGAFTCYDSVGLESAIAAAEHRQAPIVVLVSPSSFKGAGGGRFAAALAAAAGRSSVEVIVQLDHVSDRDAISRAADAGFSAVMADGSKLSFDDNVALARFAVDAVGPLGVGVEGELGHVEGDEDRAYATIRGSLTEPGEVAAFAARSGVDCLAVAVGNVHGRYLEAPRIDWGRLEEIASLAGVPLALHGASGLPDDLVRRAVAVGVAKVNVNTELRGAYFGELEAAIPDCRGALDLAMLGRRVGDVVRRVVEDKLELFGWPVGGTG